MADRDPACIFCRIVAGEIPASFVHRDATAAAFMDVRPLTTGHLLVIPNEHYARLGDVPAETWVHVTRIARGLVAALRAGGSPADGVNLLVADGEAAGQEVPHLHVHVIPRAAGDGFGFHGRAPLTTPPSRDELDRAAEAIRAAIGDE